MFNGTSHVVKIRYHAHRCVWIRPGQTCLIRPQTYLDLLINYVVFCCSVTAAVSTSVSAVSCVHCHWCLVGWTTQRCLAFLTIKIVIRSPSSTRQPSRSSICCGETAILLDPWQALSMLGVRIGSRFDPLMG